MTPFNLYSGFGVPGAAYMPKDSWWAVDRETFSRVLPLQQERMRRSYYGQVEQLVRGAGDVARRPKAVVVEEEA